MGAAAILALAACGTSGLPASSHGTAGSVTGRVTAGPTCPVEQVGRPCPPRPVVATVQASSGTRVVVSTQSSADGSYRLDVPAGSYTITATAAGAFPRCSPKSVVVAAGREVVAAISCDTGIR